MTYQEALSYLESMEIFGVKLGLARIERLMELLDLPQERYRTIHVTGTNGKGSTAAMLARILRQSGLHVGLYTSPHLVSYTERVRLDGQCISEQEFADCVETIKTYAERMVQEGAECPTQFEVLTALAFFYFAMKRVDYAVIEVGLGGLLDSTNVIVPEVSVITNVTFEHADRCGGTLAGVARHKAGIIKEGVPVVTAATGEPLAIIRAEAEAKNADIFVLGEEFTVEQGEFQAERGRQGLRFSSELLGVSDLELALHLLGPHQRQNAACAVMAAALLHNVEPRVDRQTVAEGLRLASWPARFELLRLPLPAQGEGAPAAEQLAIVDGAHNPAGARALRSSLDEYFPVQERVFLLGILHDKAIDEIIDVLLRPNDTVIVTRPGSERAEPPEALARSVLGRAQHVETVAIPCEAADRALELAAGGRLLVATGSLYLVGGVREYLLQKGRGEADV